MAERLGHQSENALPNGAQGVPVGSAYVTEASDGAVSNAHTPIVQPVSLGGSYLTAEISASAVKANLAALRERLSPPTMICAVVKADCYGHGLETLLPIIAADVEVIGVATPQEALAVRRLGCERPVLMFFSACAHGDVGGQEELLDELIANRIVLTVTTREEVAAAAAAAERLASRANLHVKVDTGMGRAGIRPEDAPALVGLIREAPMLEFSGLYTHFATADEADKTFTNEQLGCFTDVVTRCMAHVGVMLHTANSAATIDMPQTHWDMVRPGIAIYGYQPSDHMRTRLELRPSLRLTGRLMQIKIVPAGSRCSYGLTHTFERDSRVGLVPVGYADGYLLALSGKAVMRIGAHEAPVCGRVSMDQTVIDLTDVPDVKVGDEVEIISPDPEAPNSVENLARLADTIPYEITSRLGWRVRRVLVD